MPLRKKIPNLQDLCIDSIAVNTVTHNEWLKKYGIDKEVSAPYRILQHLWSDDLVQKVFAILSQNHGNKNLSLLENSIFQSRETGSLSDWPLLKLLFNKYTTCFMPPKFLRFHLRQIGMSEGFLSFLTSECKNLRSINETFCGLAGKRLGETILKFEMLREINLGRIESEEILIKILKTCPFLRRFSADGRKYISDNFLLSLCKHQSEKEGFIYCPEDGKCSESGKYLESLQISVMCTVGEGMACGLQHLTALKEVVKLPVESYVCSGVMNIIEGIKVLTEAANAVGRSPVILQIRSILFPTHMCQKTVESVLVSCPELEAAQVHLTWYQYTPPIYLKEIRNLRKLYLFDSNDADLCSPYMQEALTVQGSKITTLSLFYSRLAVDLTSINYILHFCYSLRSLTLWCIKIRETNGYSNLSLPSCTNSLEEIILYEPDSAMLPPSARGYFRKLLCNAVNIKYLSVSSDFAETEFPQTIEENGFRFLEELHLSDADTRQIPLLKLVNGENSLRKIEFSGRLCKQGVSMCKMLARKNNYELEIVHK